MDIDFTKWPMYKEVNKHGTDIDVLHNGNRAIIKELRKISKDNRKIWKYTSAHMDDEIIQHTKVEATLQSLLKDKQDRDTIRDTRERVKEKVYASLAVVVAVGAYNIFMDMMIMKQALTGG